MASRARIELFFKSPAELRERVTFLSAQGVSAFNLVNKHADDDVLGWAAMVADTVPSAKLCVHHSLKYNRAKGQRRGAAAADAAYERFATRLRRLHAAGLELDLEVLLVSGSGDKQPLDAVACLERWAQEEDAEELAMPLGVAFNPYEPGEEEKQRLVAKAATGCVRTVWLQFGADVERLRETLAWLRAQEPLAKLRVVGSVFLPTKKLLAQQRFRPWKGVYLSEAYLRGPEDAAAVTRELLGVYAAFDVEMLVEAPGVRTAKDMEVVRDLCDHRMGLREDGDAGGRASDEETAEPSRTPASEEEPQKPPPSKRSRPPSFAKERASQGPRRRSRRSRRKAGPHS